jgi:hypothetical protein
MWKSNIEKFLESELKLELHSEKTSIIPLHKGVHLLGFHCFYYHRLLKKTKIKNFILKLKSAKSDEDNRKKLDGWFAHAKWANTYKLRRKIAGQTNFTCSQFLSGFS